MGALTGLITVVAATVATVNGGFNYPFLLWGGVVVVTFYYASMSGLGAWYAGLRAVERTGAATTTEPATSGPRP